MARKKKIDEVRRYRHPGLYRTAPVKQRCGGCHVEVDGCWYEGFPMQLDRYDLSQFGEVQALLLKIPTFHVLDEHVYRRTGPSITRAPVPKQGRIRREHRCGLMPPSDAASAVFETAAHGGECPY